MRAHRLYPDPAAPPEAGGLLLPVRACAGRELDPHCTRCPMHRSARHPCVPAEGEPGGALLVGERPGRAEDVLGRPFVGESGKYLRGLLARLSPGPVALDNALRCAGDPDGESVERCRPYLTKTIAEVAPRRVVAMGAFAWQSITGRTTQPLAQRRSFCWMGDVPVFLTVNPAAATRNRFIARDFEADLAWALSADPPFPSPADLTWEEVETAADAGAACSALRAAGWAAIDAETSGRQYTPGFRVISLAAAGPGGTCWVWGKAQLDDPGVSAPLRALLSDPAVGKVGANLKSDLAFLAERVARVRGVRGDVRLWRKMVQPGASGYLEDMAELVGFGGHKAEMEVGLARAEAALRRRLASGGRQTSFDLGDGGGPAYDPGDIGEQLARGATVKNFSYGLVPRGLLMRYNARDAASTARLAELLEPRVEGHDGLRRVWHEIVLPMSEALAVMEATGVPVDEAAIDSFDAHLSGKIAAALSKVAVAARDAGMPDFNPGSTRQVAELVFDRLKVRPPADSATDGGAQSTAEAVLEAVKDRCPVAADILEYRGLAKMKGTYCDGMRAHMRRDQRGYYRIHPTILPDGTVTGRASCIEPNLQNIPRAADSFEGKLARSIFRARPGWVMLQADYSQLEFRIAAMLSGDPEMLAIIRAGVDFHTGTAMVIAPHMWKVTYALPGDVPKPHRSVAKTVNFALLYRQGVYSTARKLGISEAEAERVHLAVLGKFRGLDRWIRAALRETKQTGQCRTWWGGAPARYRPLYMIGDPDEARRADGERRAVNTPVQGTAADYCNASISAVSDWLREDHVPAELCLAIHDALLLHVREDAVDEVAAQVRRLMLQYPSGGVPLDVDVEVGPSWGSLKKLEVRA